MSYCNYDEYILEVNRVEDEIKRFRLRIQELRTRFKSASNRNLLFLTGCRETGAVKRASQDLSRELVKFRGRR